MKEALAVLAAMVWIGVDAAHAEAPLAAAGLRVSIPVEAGDPEAGGHNCCEVHAGGGCTDPDIEDCVCAIDNFCCDVMWDQTCVNWVEDGGCGTCEPVTSCFEPHNTPGCDDAFIQSCVCVQDPFCCTVEWDQQCVSEVFEFGCVDEPPANDDCADALDVVSDGVILFRTNLATTDGPALPQDCDEGAGLAFESDIWFCYTPDCTNDVTVSLCGPSTFNARMAIYEGCQCPAANDRLIDCKDDSPTCPVAQRPEITFPAMGGNSYLIRIGDVGGLQGDGTMEISGGSTANQLDCNQNGTPDGCELLADPSADCNGNQYVDACEADNGEVLLHQVPNQLNGLFADADCEECPTGEQTRAERFQLDAFRQIVAIGLWGGYFPNNLPPPNDAFTVLFHTDDGGEPGTLISTHPNVPSVRVQTGVMLFGVSEWLYVLTLPSPEPLDAGAYLVEVFNNSTGTGDSFFWEIGSLDATHGLPGSAFDVATPGEIWTYEAGANMAMVLFGEPAADCDDDNVLDECQETAACCMPDDLCEDRIPECCVDEGGIAQALGTDCATFDCVLPEVVHEQGLADQTRPYSGYIDPRQESTNGVDFDLGLQETYLRFNMDVYACDGSDVDVGDFVLSETGESDPPIVDAVEYVGGDRSYVRVHWDRPITAQHWTTVRANVCSASGSPIVNLGNLGPDADEPDRVDLGFLPCDVNQSGLCDPFDLLLFRQAALGQVTPTQGTLTDFFDINRNGVFGTADVFDLLRFRQLVNGVPPATRVWNNATMTLRP